MSIAHAGKHTYKGKIALNKAKTPSGDLIGKVEVIYKLDVFMQEPLENFAMRYAPASPRVKLFGPVKFKAQVYNGVHPSGAWIEIYPDDVPAPNADFGYHFPSSPDWDEFFTTYYGETITAERAKEIYRKGNLRLDDLEITKAKLEKKNDKKSKFPVKRYLNKVLITSGGIGETGLGKALAANEIGWSNYRKHKNLSWADSGIIFSADYKGRSFKARSYRLDSLPKATEKGEPMDYAHVEFTVLTTNGFRTHRTKLREGDTWIGVFELFGYNVVVSNIKITRAVLPKDDEEDDKKKKSTSKEGATNSNKDTNEGSNKGKPKKRADPFDADRKVAGLDPFSRHLAKKKSMRETAERKKREQEKAKGVTSLVYMVVKESVIIQKGSCEGGLFLSSSDATESSKRALSKRKSEAVRAGNRFLEKDFKRLQALVKQQFGSQDEIYSQPFALNVSSRAREPFELTKQEKWELSQWNWSRQKMLTTKKKLPQTKSYKHHLVRFNANYCEIVSEEFFFHSIEEAEAFLKGKPRGKVDKVFSIKK